MDTEKPESTLKDLYDEDYAARLASADHSIRLRTLLSRVELPEGARVLDVGCGSGPLAILLAPRVAEYHGVDFSEAFVRRATESAARAGLANCRFHCADVVTFVDAMPGTFDAVFALDISEHVPDEEWSAIVGAMHRALRPGGQVVLHTPNLDFFVERMKQRDFILKQYEEHVAVRDPAGNAAFLHRAGFRDVVVHALPHYNILRLLHPLRHLPWMGDWFVARLLLTGVRA